MCLLLAASHAFQPGLAKNRNLNVKLQRTHFIISYVNCFVQKKRNAFQVKSLILESNESDQISFREGTVKSFKYWTNEIRKFNMFHVQTSAGYLFQNI